MAAAAIGDFLTFVECLLVIYIMGMFFHGDVLLCTNAHMEALLVLICERAQIGANWSVKKSKINK